MTDESAKSPKIRGLLAGNEHAPARIQVDAEAAQAQAAPDVVPAEVREVDVATALPAGLSAQDGDRPPELLEGIQFREGETLREILELVFTLLLDEGCGLLAADGAVELVQLERHVAQTLPLDREVGRRDVRVDTAVLVGVLDETLQTEVAVDRDVMDLPEPSERVVVAIGIVEEPLQGGSIHLVGGDLPVKLAQLRNADAADDAHGVSFLYLPVIDSRASPALCGKYDPGTPSKQTRLREFPACFLILLLNKAKKQTKINSLITTNYTKVYLFCQEYG